MNSFVNRLNAQVLLLTFLAITTTSINRLSAQSLPVVSSELTFADVSIYLSEASRLQIQQEIRLLYANRRQLEQDMDALYELTPLWLPTFLNADLSPDFRYVALPFNSTTTPVYWSVQPQQRAIIGLRLDQAVDESRHPLIAAEKVSDYLKQLRGKYQENAVRLLLRYLSSNPSTLSGTAAKTQAESVWLDIDSPPLIWKILARKIMIEYQASYRPAVTYSVYSYELGGGKTLAVIARQLSLPESRFQPYNDWLKTTVVPTAPIYPVLIRLTNDEFPAVWSAGVSQNQSGVASPTSKLDLGFPVLLKSSVREDGLRAPAIFYTINERRGIQAQACDNPITLAYYGGISPADFLKYNDLTEQDVVRPGQIYYLKRKAKRAKIPFHVVQRNQSLRDVANIYGMRLSSLLRFNRIETTKRAGPGRVLWLQKKRPRNRPVEYQRLPPQPAPVLPLPEPVLARIDSAVTPAAAPANERSLTPPPASEPPIVIAEKRPAPPKPVDEAILVTPAPLPGNQVAVLEEEEPVPATPVATPVPAATSAPRQSAAIAGAVVKTHVVKPGQTYYAISNMYGVTPNQLYAWNDLSEKIPLEIGQELIVSVTRKPVPGRPATVTVLPGQSSKGIVNKFVVEGPKPVVYHVVQPGQTVYRIALINKTTVANLVKWNTLKDYTIEVGQKLIVRSPQ